jgi:2-haloacid dehalogenase
MAISPSRNPFMVLHKHLVGFALTAGMTMGLHASLPSVERVSRSTPRFKAVAFDYLVLFNPDSIVPRAEALFPGKGRELTSLWRTRQFEYTWLRSIDHRYVDFSVVTKDALIYAADALHLDLTKDAERRLLDGYLDLAPWPDTIDTLRALKHSGVRVIALSNFTPAVLGANAAHAGAVDLFDALVSTDERRTYKPDPRAYQLGVERLHLEKSEILYAAFGGWDAAGAKAFGYPTYWANRANQPIERLGVVPDWTSTNLRALLDLVTHGADSAVPPPGIFAASTGIRH